MHKRKGFEMQIAQNSVVAFHYKLTNDAGEVLDSSEGREPLTYLHGAGNIIPGLEKELEGHGSGDKLQVAVAPNEGYGEVQPALVQEVPRDAFQGVDIKGVLQGRNTFLAYVRGRLPCLGSGEKHRIDIGKIVFFTHALHED